jgi:hypothetical protein
LDGDQFVIAICDDCITEKLEEGIIAYTGNYMFNGQVIEEKVEKYKKIWRRNNNLSDLIN